MNVLAWPTYLNCFCVNAATGMQHNMNGPPHKPINAPRPAPIPAPVRLSWPIVKFPTLTLASASLPGATTDETDSPRFNLARRGVAQADIRVTIALNRLRRAFYTVSTLKSAGTQFDLHVPT